MPEALVWAAASADHAIVLCDLAEAAAADAAAADVMVMSWTGRRLVPPKSEHL